jgi:hypothetical protein
MHPRPYISYSRSGPLLWQLGFSESMVFDATRGGWHAESTFNGASHPLGKTNWAPHDRHDTGLANNAINLRRSPSRSPGSPPQRNAFEMGILNQLARASPQSKGSSPYQLKSRPTELDWASLKRAAHVDVPGHAEGLAQLRQAWAQSPPRRQ